MNLNRVTLAGRMVREPEMQFLPSNNTAVTRIGLAINRKWKNAQGELQEEVTFVDCEAFGKTAEAINQYFHKGSPIFVEGRLKLDQWQDKEGSNRSKLKVVVESFQFIESKRDESSAPPEPPARKPEFPRNKTHQPLNKPPPAKGDHEPIDESSIPF